MTLVCADCRTPNRDGGKFCIGCGRRLVAGAATRATVGPDGGDDWPATLRMPAESERPVSMLAPAASRPAVARPAASIIAAKPPPPPVRSSVSRAAGLPRRRRVRGANGFRKLFIGLVVTLLVAVTVAWFVFERSTRVAPALVVPMPPARPAAPAPAPVSSPPPALEKPAAALPAEPAVPVTPTPTPTEAAPPAAAPPAETSGAPPPQATPAKPATAAPRKARKPAAAPPAAPAAVAAPAPAPEPVAPAAPAVAASPQSLCADLNFFSRARCMAAQCAKSDFKSQPQCDAVRHQQQIEEEKRNPALSN